MQRMPALSESDLSLFEIRTRYVRNYLTFAGRNSKDFLLYISGPAVYDSPAVDVEMQAVPGKNGDLVKENAKAGERRFKNVDISYDAFFFDALAPKTAAVKSWLLSPVGYQVLHDTYDSEFFRMGICKDAVAFTPRRDKGATMKLTFHCQPQRWSVEGQRKIELTSPATLKNPYEFSAKPIIRVYGSGAGTLYVGDTPVDILANDGYIDLNCETHNAYDSQGFCNGYVKSDDFPDLKPGQNHISWNGNIDRVVVTPRWWTL